MNFSDKRTAQPTGTRYTYGLSNLYKIHVIRIVRVKQTLNAIIKTNKRNTVIACIPVEMCTFIRTFLLNIYRCCLLYRCVIYVKHIPNAGYVIHVGPTHPILTIVVKPARLFPS